MANAQSDATCDTNWWDESSKSSELTDLAATAANTMRCLASTPELRAAIVTAGAIPHLVALTRRTAPWSGGSRAAGERALRILERDPSAAPLVAEQKQIQLALPPPAACEQTLARYHAMQSTPASLTDSLWEVRNAMLAVCSTDSYSV